MNRFFFEITVVNCFKKHFNLIILFYYFYLINLEELKQIL